MPGRLGPARSPARCRAVNIAESLTFPRVDAGPRATGLQSGSRDRKPPQAQQVRILTFEHVLEGTRALLHDEPHLTRVDRDEPRQPDLRPRRRLEYRNQRRSPDDLPATSRACLPCDSKTMGLPRRRVSTATHDGDICTSAASRQPDHATTALVVPSCRSIRRHGGPKHATSLVRAGLLARGLPGTQEVPSPAAWPAPQRVQTAAASGRSAGSRASWVILSGASSRAPCRPRRSSGLRTAS